MFFKNTEGGQCYTKDYVASGCLVLVLVFVLPNFIM